MSAVDPPASEAGNASTAQPSAAPPTPAAIAAAPARHCENCGVLLLGEHCHACGQPTKGLVRHFSSVIGDFFDTVFNIDSRVLRTIGPLLTRPGYLSLEYFAGRRIRYVTPTRLFLFLSLVAFFAMQGSIEINEQGGGIHVGGSNNNNDSISAAKTAKEVTEVSAKALAELDKARKEVEGVPGGTVGIDMARQKIREKADERIAELEASEKARRAGKPAPAPAESSDNNINFPVNGKLWDPETNPIAFGWVPQPVNAALNKRLKHARDVLKSSNSEKPLVDALFNVLPQTLIVLMPLFALMLKIAYWFRRRLYMEHLIVALHSHSFISLAITLLIGFNWLQDWLAPKAGFVNGVFGWAVALTGLWIPVYLLLMQKRVYGQGWIMTLLKFGVLGICYSVLLGFGLMGAVVVGLLTL